MKWKCGTWPLTWLPGRKRSLTSDPGREGASWDVLVVVFDQDAVVPWQDREVGHCAGPILVVHAADVCFGWPLDGQRKTTCVDLQQRTKLYFSFCKIHSHKHNQNPDYLSGFCTKAKNLTSVPPAVYVQTVAYTLWRKKKVFTCMCSFYTHV